MYFHRVHQKSQGFRLWDLETMSDFTSRYVIFDEESMMQERSETEDKVQGGAPDSSVNSQVKGLSSQMALKGLIDQMRTS